MCVCVCVCAGGGEEAACVASMVQRGSKIRPDATLADSQRAVEAQDFLEQKKRELARARAASQDILQRRESAEAQRVDDAELEAIVRILIAKLKAVEEANASASAASAKLKRTLLQLTCGGIAGACARTFVAPIDRVKILRQTQHVSHGFEKYGGSILSIVRQVVREEGWRGLWRGNGVNCIRIIPYAGTQFVTYDYAKGFIASVFQAKKDGTNDFAVVKRLSAGVCAAAMATTLTHPMDVVRIRLTVEPDLRGLGDAAVSILKEGKFGFYKGYTASVLSLAPFTAMNFAAFDTLKDAVAKVAPEASKSTFTVLGLGGTAGLVAQMCCFPLDTVRRRMQLKGTHYNGLLHAFRSIVADEGFRGLYKGMSANALKVIPNSAVRFTVFDKLKEFLHLN